MGKTALVLITDGTEEMEAVIVVDVLRRAQVDVTLAGLDDKAAATCSRNVRIVPDISLKEAAAKGPYDVIVLPGEYTTEKNLCGILTCRLMSVTSSNIVKAEVSIQFVQK